MMYLWMVVFCMTGTLMQVESENQQCGKRKTTRHTFVIGGKDAKRGDWPWQVLLLSYGLWPFCGGTLINNQWIITAAHCMGTNVRSKTLVIRLGDHDRGKTEDSQVDVKVKRIIVHHRYKIWTLSYDIALIQLAKPVSFNKYVSPICLPAKEAPVGTKCFITGWGKMTSRGTMVPILQQGVLPVVSPAVCQRVNGRIKRITRQMICGGDKGKTRLSGCHGDSGGPYVCKLNNRWELHGSVSWGPGTCSSSSGYTVFARIYFFKDWIKKMMANPPPLPTSPDCKNIYGRCKPYKKYCKISWHMRRVCCATCRGL